MNKGSMVVEFEYEGTLDLRGIERVAYKALSLHVDEFVDEFVVTNVEASDKSLKEAFEVGL